MNIQGESDTVLVVNFGTRFYKLIARRVRECVLSEIVPHNAALTL